MATRSRPDPSPFETTVVLWIFAPLVAGASLLAPFVPFVALGYYGILLVLPLAFLSLGLGFWGLWWAREAGFDIRFYLPVLGGLIALLPAAAALHIFVFPPARCSPGVGNCLSFLFLYLALVLGIALFSVPALLSLWVQNRTARRPPVAA